MKILFAAAEAVPFVKTGGLADVIGSLPKELAKRGHDIRVVLPKYAVINNEYVDAMQFLFHINVPVAWRQQHCGVFMLKWQGVIFYFIDNEYYFKRPELYGYYDDAERFAFFSRAVLAILPSLDFQPDVIHTHDWHVGPVNIFLRSLYSQDPFYNMMRTVFTIHNLRYQGIFPAEVLTSVMGLDWSYFRSDLLEFVGTVNYMKAGLVYADKITTVSQTYAQEIQDPFFGEGLEGLLAARQHDMMGIVNGIDYEVYDPGRDLSLLVAYTADDFSEKQVNKEALQKRIGLAVNLEAPILTVVSRLVGPKGLELFCHIFDEMMVRENIQVVVLGTGEKQYEQFFRAAAVRYPDKAWFGNFFDESLARLIYGGADLFIMPSLFEPCGIGQLIAMRYGTLPVVRETGGLRDTVQSYNEFTGTGNGFSFANYNAHELLFTIQRALRVYREDKPAWHRLMCNAMTGDYSWGQSASVYEILYRQIADA